MFNGDEKSSWLKAKIFFWRSNLHYHFSFKKKFSSMENRPQVWGIWNTVIYGPNISLGRDVIIVAANGYRTCLTTVRHGQGEGKIHVGDRVLVMNGVRVSSASEIIIEDDCMLANMCYIMDADWHDIYDRHKSPGRTRPVHLKRGAWIGDSAIVCKGVTVGEHSIVGAGSVVREDVPPNTVVIGNPARAVKKIDPDKVILMKQAYRDLGVYDKV